MTICTKYKLFESWHLDDDAWKALSLNPVGARNHFTQYDVADSQPQSPTWLISTEKISLLTDSVDSLLNTQLKRNIHASLLEYEMKALKKWLAPQGATPSLQHLHAVLKQYYPPHDYRMVGDFSKGIEELQRVLRRSGFKPGSLRFLSPVEVMNEYQDDPKNSYSGVFLAGNRRSEEVQQLTLRHVIENPWGLEPPLAGHRWMRNKLRSIFMDEFGNLLRMSGMIDPVFRILRDIPGFEMFKGKYKTDITISQYLDVPFLALEGDFDAMDTRVTYTNTRAIVVPILKFMFHENDHDKIDHFIYEMFHMPLVVSKDELWTGTHSLFSGLKPTSLFESIMSWILLATMLLEISYPRRGYTRHTLWHIARIFVLGDDNAVMLFLKHPEKFINYKWDTRYGHMTLTEAFTFYARLMLLEANVLKQREAFNNFWFCRELHQKAGRQFVHVTGLDVVPGIYPIILSLNSVLYPEYGSQSELSMELLRIFSILDNVWGHPLAQPYWQLIFSFFRLSNGQRLKLTSLNFTDEEIALFNKKKLKDFKYILSGFQYDLDNSPSYQWLVHSRMIVPAYRSNI